MATIFKEKKALKLIATMVSAQLKATQAYGDYRAAPSGPVVAAKRHAVYASQQARFDKAVADLQTLIANHP